MKKYILLFSFVVSIAIITNCTNDEDNDSLEVITPVDNEEGISIKTSEELKN